MKVKYVGPALGGVEVAGEHVPHGGTVEVPVEVAAGLLEQKGNWQKVKEPKPKPTNETGEG